MARDTQYVRGAERLARRIATIRANLALPPMTDEIGRLLLRRTQERFDREVDPDGKPWRPLAASTLRRKAIAYPGKGKLKRTESLRRAIRIIRGGAGTMFTNTGAGVRIGVEDPKIAAYGSLQNNGNPGRIPARRFLGIGALDVKAVDAFLRRAGDRAMTE